METKRYLKTVEDVIALKDTDTKIYREDTDGYCQFIKGTLCGFHNDFWCIGATIDDASNCYIIEEEPMQEATEADIGKLCWFYADDIKKDERDIGILTGLPYEEGDSRHYEMDNTYYYKHCRRLTPSEVAELTGYKVEEK